MSKSDGSNSTPCTIPTIQPVPDGSTEFLPPWTPQAEAWWIFSGIPMPWQTKELPKGALDTKESDKLQEFQATYQGGLGTIQLMRFYSSPVGRRNWNAPKHLARFEFTPQESSDPLSPMLVSVYPALSDSSSPDFSPDPIFSARLAPSRHLPNFPLSLSNFPRVLFDTQVIQPPLNGPIGTEKWCTVDVGYSGHVRVMYPEPGLEGARYGDGIGFPDLQPMSIGLWCPKVDLFFPPPGILDLTSMESKKTK